MLMLRVIHKGESTMPDLQSELSKIAHAWDSHEQIIRSPQAKPQPQQEKAMTFQPTGNMSKDTFDYVKMHSCLLTQAQTAKDVSAMGYKYQSVQALITQMKRNSMIKVDSDNRLYTTQDEYKSFVNPYKVEARIKQEKAKAKEARAQKKAALKATGIAALKPDATAPAAMFTPAPAPTALTAQAVLNQLSVGEAYALYTELAKMFGGK